MTKTLSVCALILLASSFVLVAQEGPAERPERSFDEVVEHLNISDGQMECLDANKDNFLDAVEPSQQQLRSNSARRRGTGATPLPSSLRSML